MPARTKQRESIAEEHRRLVQEGLASIERGEYTEYDEAGLKEFFADVIERGKKRLASKRKNLLKKTG